MAFKRRSFPFGDDFGLGVVVFLRQFVAPVKQRLSNDGRDRRIVEFLLPRVEDFRDEIVAPPPFDPRAPLPSTDLTLIVVAASALRALRGKGCV